MSVSDIFLKVIPMGFTYYIMGTAAPDIGLFLWFYPWKVLPQPEPLGGFAGKIQTLAQKKVSTKSGTYRITAPTPEYLTRMQQQTLCEYYVKRYEMNRHNWQAVLFDGPMIKRLCGISLDDIVNNIHGATNGVTMATSGTMSEVEVQELV